MVDTAILFYPVVTSAPRPKMPRRVRFLWWLVGAPPEHQRPQWLLEFASWFAWTVLRWHADV